MHIILGLVGIIGAFGAYWFMFRNAGRAAGEAIDAAETVRGVFRRRAFRKKSESSILAGVDDPALAATIFLFKLAEAGEIRSEQTKVLIRRIAEEEMQIAKPDEALTFAEWAAAQTIEENDIVRRFAPLWIERLSPRELAEFGAMAQRIARDCGEPGGRQREMMRYLRERLAIGPDASNP